LSSLQIIAALRHQSAIFPSLAWPSPSDVAARRQSFGTLIVKSSNHCRFAASIGNLSLTCLAKSLGCCRQAAAFWYLDFQVFNPLPLYS
jgi:hypothetical protein